MYAFGAFELDPRSHELRRGGIRIKIQDQPFLILVKLLERPGQIVTRDELRSALWHDGTFVDFDTSLNSAVKRLREALGDSVEAPAFIETLPKLGYRFVSPVEVRPPERPVDSAESKPSRVKRSVPWRLRATAAAVLFAGIAATFFYVRSRGAPPSSALEVVPLTGLDETENGAAFSLDGYHVAFVVPEPAERAGIYIMLIGGEKPLRLTADANDCCPIWSPDGRAVSFASKEQDGYTLYTVPALGGTPKVLYPKQSYFTQHINQQPPSFSWSPDGSELAISTASPTLRRPAITLISIEGGPSRPITSPPRDYSDWSPAFSPDGESVAFLRSSGTGDDEDVYTVPATGGQGKRLTFDSRPVLGLLAWTPDSRDIIFASQRAGAWALWRVPASGGNPQRVEGVGTSAILPAIALNGQRLAYTSISFRVSFRRINLMDSKHVSGSPRAVLSSKAVIGLPSFSADGSEIAFESTQSGYDEIWTAASDGSSPRQLTFLKGASGTPHWSYDGRLIAFDYRPGEKSEIYVVDVSGGPPRKVAINPGANNITPAWSRDGHWIYFASSQGQDSFQVWKAHYPEGGTIQLTQRGGMFPLEGADGYLYYSKSVQSDEIWKIPVDGGPESLVVKVPALNCFCAWTLAPRGVYFIASDHRRLSFYDFSDRTISELLRLEKYTNNPALSPDGKDLIVSQVDYDQTIMLVNHFR